MTGHAQQSGGPGSQTEAEASKADSRQLRYMAFVRRIVDVDALAGAPYREASPGALPGFRWRQAAGSAVCELEEAAGIQLDINALAAGATLEEKSSLTPSDVFARALTALSAAEATMRPRHGKVISVHIHQAGASLNGAACTIARLALVVRGEMQADAVAEAMASPPRAPNVPRVWGRAVRAAEDLDLVGAAQTVAASIDEAKNAVARIARKVRVKKQAAVRAGAKVKVRSQALVEPKITPVVPPVSRYYEGGFSPPLTVQEQRRLYEQRQRHDPKLPPFDPVPH